MKLILDQGLPRSTVGHLASRGISSVHVSEIGLSGATDLTILDEARIRNEIVVTLDADFHQLLANSKAINPSVIRIRVEGLTGASLADLLARAVAAAGQDLQAGCAVSVSASRIRVRRLPIT